MNSPEINRRRFERLQLTEAAIAVDETGYQLGRVSAAGGGGMQVDAPSSDALEHMKSGSRLSVTVVEPGSATTNTFDVEVCYVDGNSVGMKFL
jgi:hypothetical protein